MWTPIADELGISWRECEALHWLIGRKEMRREANAITFAIAAADAEPRELRQVVQRDGTLESTEVFEGRDLTPIRSPSVSGCPDGHGPGTPGHPASTPVNITLIDSEPSSSVYEEDDDRGEEVDSEGEEEDDSEGEEEKNGGEEEEDSKGEEEEERGPSIWRKTKVDEKLRLPGITSFVAGGYGFRREAGGTRWPVRRGRHTVYTVLRKPSNRQRL